MAQAMPLLMRAPAIEIFSQRQFWAIDPLYPGVKRTANYNTMLFKGVGQLGEQAAFGSMEALYFKHYPHVIHAAAGSAYDYTVGDVTRAYHPALGLRRFIRHLLFIKPDILLMADEVELLSRGMVHNYHSDSLQTAGGLTHASNGYVVGPEGEAFTLFNGQDGQYQLTAVYLDNHPGIGNYALEVDGKPAHCWQSRDAEKSRNADDHTGFFCFTNGKILCWRATIFSGIEIEICDKQAVGSKKPSWMQAHRRKTACCHLPAAYLNPQSTTSPG